METQTESNATSAEKVAKVIAKISQLRALSASTHSRAESETTAAMAAKLIAQYQLDEAILQQEKGEASDIDVNLETFLYETGKIVPWKSSLAIGLASLNGLFIFNSPTWSETRRRVTRYRIIGSSSAIEITKYMWEYLVNEVPRLAKENIDSGGKRGVNVERESYCSGVVAGFIAKMKAEKAEVIKTNETAMVLVENFAKKAEDLWRKETGKTLSKHSGPASKAQRNHSAYSSGYTQGQSMSVNKGLK
jgi:hypothetical protein